MIMAKNNVYKCYLKHIQMKYSVKNGLALLIAWFLMHGCVQRVAESNGIPFSEAIDKAAIEQDSLDDIHENSLLLGNGDLNGLVNVADGKLIIRITKNDVGDWRHDTSRDTTLIPWRLLEQSAAEGKLNAGTWGWANPYPAPIPCGRAVIDLGLTGTADGVLDIRKAVALIGDNSQPAATVRCLDQANVFLIEGGTGGSLLSHEVEHLPTATSGKSGSTVTLFQELPAGSDWPGMSYAVAMAVRGNIRAMAVVSGFDAADPLTEAVALAEKTAAARLKQTVEIHEQGWDRFWSQSGISLEDEYLTSTWYRNLYFLRTVSRPGKAAAGLFAGLVSDGVPAWHAAHTMNYNAEQPFWSAFSTNHIELADSYRGLVMGYADNARWLCDQLFGFEGLYFPHNISTFNNDHATSSQPGGGVHMHLPWGYSVCITGWAVQNPWWEYEYGGKDTAFLREIYPMLRDAALFYSNFTDSICERTPGGKVRFGPSVSPEHFGFSKDLSMNWNDVSALAFARFALRTGIESARTLHIDEDLVQKFSKSLDLLPDYPVYGVGDDRVVVSVEGAPPIEYNIPVPALPVFPAEQITWFSPEEEKSLFVRTIGSLKSNGNNDAMILCHARARLSMHGTYEYVVNSFKNRQQPNGILTLNVLGSHFNPFGHYTEQFAASAVVSELLLQSVNDIIRIFPAWPADKDAAFENLRAKGGFLVSSDLKEGRVTRVTVTATADHDLRILDPFDGAPYESNLLVSEADKLIQCRMSAGQTLYLTVP
jgi:hypothetical protein